LKTYIIWRLVLNVNGMNASCVDCVDMIGSVECLAVQDQVDVCKHVIYYCVQMKKDIERMTDAQHAAK